MPRFLPKKKLNRPPKTNIHKRIEAPRAKSPRNLVRAPIQSGRKSRPLRSSFSEASRSEFASLHSRVKNPWVSRRRTKVFLLGLVFPLFFILLILSLKTYKVITSSIWDGQHNINFVVSARETLLISFNPESSDSLILSLPENLLVEVTHGYGSYRVEAVHRLEEIEGRKGLLAESLQESLGLPVDGYLISAKDADVNFGKLKSKLFQESLSGGKTNFSAWDLMRLWWLTRGLDESQVRKIDLEKSNVLLEKRLADNSQVWEMDTSLLDNFLEKYMTFPGIKKIEVEVLNATDHPGFGEKAARLVGNAGGEVVFIGNSPENLTQCQAQSSKEQKNEYLVKKLIKLFGCNWAERREGAKGEVVLVIGENYWQKLNEK